MFIIQKQVKKGVDFMDEEEIVLTEEQEVMHEKEVEEEVFEEIKLIESEDGEVNE